MKTYFRLLAFAKPYSRFVPSYAILAILAVLFGLVNFSLLIPLLNVLFNAAPETAAPAKPTFALNIEYFKDQFNYTFYNIRAQQGAMGALKYVCGIILISVFLANLFKYL